SIDLPLPPEPTSAMRVGRVARIVRASVLTSALRPFMPRGRGGKIERGGSLRKRVFGGVFGILVVPRPLHSTRCDERKKKCPRLSSGAPLALDTHQLVENTVEAAVYRDGADLLRHLLEGLELLQAERDRVVLHDLRSVQQRARRVRLLTTADDIRLSNLLRFHHLAQDVLHV